MAHDTSQDIMRDYKLKVLTNTLGYDINIIFNFLDDIFNNSDDICSDRSRVPKNNNITHIVRKIKKERNIYFVIDYKIKELWYSSFSVKRELLKIINIPAKELDLAIRYYILRKYNIQFRTYLSYTYDPVQNNNIINY